MQAYTIFTAPAIFILTAYFIVYLGSIKRQLRFKFLPPLLVFLLLTLPIRYSLERIKPFDLFQPTPQWLINVKHLNESVLDKKKVIFNTIHPIETMFYTEFIAYEVLPSPLILKAINAKGYKVYISQEKEIPIDFRGLDYANIIDLGTH